MEYYINNIRNIPLLTPEKEREVTKIIVASRKKLAEINKRIEENKLPQKNLDRLKIQRKMCYAQLTASTEEMVRGNVRLVISIAKKFAFRSIPLIDLIQEGNIGLLTAIEKFDPSLGFRFSTYATWWIRQGITHSIANNGRIIRVPVHLVDMLNKYQKLTKQFIQQQGREPTEVEIRVIMNLSKKKLKTLIDIIAEDPISLNKTLTEDNDGCLENIIEDTNSVDPDLEIDLIRSKIMINELLTMLPERDREILEMRYGLGRDVCTLEEVGNKFNISRERVRQIQESAVISLREEYSNRLNQS